MPHFDAQGREEWVCQKGGHICTGDSTYVERDSDLSKQLGCVGNVCPTCLARAQRPMGLREYCKLESGLDGQALTAYINRYYGHG